jgi:hypothetical protein
LVTPDDAAWPLDRIGYNAKGQPIGNVESALKFKRSPTCRHIFDAQRIAPPPLDSIKRLSVKNPTPLPPKPAGGIVTPTAEVKVMTGERELTKRILAKDANFRLIVGGVIGVKEIERPIQKLQIEGNS